jgi:hypothetical protein
VTDTRRGLLNPHGTYCFGFWGLLYDVIQGSERLPFIGGVPAVHHFIYIIFSYQYKKHTHNIFLY